MNDLIEKIRESALTPEAVVGLIVAGVMVVLFVVTQVIASARQRSLRKRKQAEAWAEGKLYLASKHETEGPPTIDDQFDSLVAGTGTGLSTAQAIGIVCFFAVGVGATIFLWRENVILAALGFLAGGLVPLVVFVVMQMLHRGKLRKQLPDMLYLLSRSLRAGLTFEQAIELGGQRGPQPLAEEFRRVASQVRLGLPVAQALAGAAKRVQLVDFDALVSTARVYATTGGNLPLIMDRLAQSARDHNTFRGHFKAATAQGRVTAICLGLAAPVLLILHIVYNPEQMEVFWANPNAYWILFGVGLLEVLGIIWLYRLLKIDY